MRSKSVAALVVVALAGIGVAVLERKASASEAKLPAHDPGEAILELQARVSELERRVPDQAIVMTHVAYHFSNLWFAAQHRDWALAGFYLGEVRSDVKWAVRLHPVRKGPAGDVDVAAIAEAIDGTEFAKL